MPAPYLVILGCGQVGRALLDMCKAGVYHKDQLVRVLAVFDSEHAVVVNAEPPFEPNQLDAAVLSEIIDAKQSGKRLGSLAAKPYTCVEPIDKAWGRILTASPLPSVVVADCSASEETQQYLEKALDTGSMGVVLANKKPISGDQAAFENFVGFDPYFKWESTVGAGSPFITTFKRLLSAGDKVKKVAGVFSGTLGYVMTGLEDGKKLSDVVVEAKKLGFTEPDPRDDLSGIDFSRKALILARMMGWKLEMSDIQLESMVPPEFSSDVMPLEDFMGVGLKALDSSFDEKVAAAKDKGEVLRYAATIQDGVCKVGLVTVSKDTPLGRLRGTDNILEIHSNIYSPSPLVIQGAGAGPDCTALGVLADSLEIFSTMSCTKK